MPDDERRKDTDGIAYKTSDILALYGLSNKGLFFYEEKGLIAPRRAAGSQYRIYTLKETARLHRCRMYRELGFSVEESINLVNSCTPASLCSSLHERKEAIFRQARKLTLVQEEIDALTALIQALDRGEVPFVVQNRPPMYRKSLRNATESYTEQNASAYLEWQGYLPLAAASLLIEREGLQPENEKLRVNLGFVIHKAYLEGLEAAPPDQATFLPPVRCLYTILIGRDDALDDTERVRPALRWMADHGYRLSGDIVTRMVATMDKGQGMQRFDQAWFPIAPLSQ